MKFSSLLLLVIALMVATAIFKWAELDFIATLAGCALGLIYSWAAMFSNESLFKPRPPRSFE